MSADPLATALYYDAAGPNPHTVRLAAAEKGITLNTIWVDIKSGENQQAKFGAVNPLKTLPVLKLASGSVIADSLAICEYLDEVRPEPALIGRELLGRAITRTWMRRIECEVALPLTLGYRAGLGRGRASARMAVLNESAAESAFQIARSFILWLNKQMSAEFIAGDILSLADLRLYAFLRFAQHAGIELLGDTAAVFEWYSRMSLRRSASA